MDKNQDIKQEITKRRLRQYEVAQQLNVSEFTLSRWLHCELTPDRKQRIISAINEASKAVGV